MPGLMIGGIHGLKTVEEMDRKAPLVPVVVEKNFKTSVTDDEYGRPRARSRRC